MLVTAIGPNTLGGRALSLNDAFSSTSEMIWNRRDVHAAELPAANGITDAASLAKMYVACIGEVDGVRLLSPTYIDRARTTLSSGQDRCLLAETTFGIGFMTSGPFSSLLGPGSFGHAGAGGSLGAAHPEAELAFGYVMNQMYMNLAEDARLAYRRRTQLSIEQPRQAQHAGHTAATQAASSPEHPAPSTTSAANHSTGVPYLFARSRRTLRRAPRRDNLYRHQLGLRRASREGAPHPRASGAKLLEERGHDLDILDDPLVHSDAQPVLLEQIAQVLAVDELNWRGAVSARFGNGVAGERASCDE